uniref:Uncharacterized protein n=1 Tax=Chrysemys picta bellii TaxID=8478 RepID=A0A8C3IV69_CHRPI
MVHLAHLLMNNDHGGHEVIWFAFVAAQNKRAGDSRYLARKEKRVGLNTERLEHWIAGGGTRSPSGGAVRAGQRRALSPAPRAPADALDTGACERSPDTDYGGGAGGGALPNRTMGRGGRSRRSTTVSQVRRPAPFEGGMAISGANQR